MMSSHTSWIFVESAPHTPPGPPGGCWYAIYPCDCDPGGTTTWLWPCDWSVGGAAFRYLTKCYYVGDPGDHFLSIPPGYAEFPTSTPEWLLSCAACCDVGCVFSCEPASAAVCPPICLDDPITLTYNFYCEPCPGCNDCRLMETHTLSCSAVSCESVFHHLIATWNCGSGITVVLDLMTGLWTVSGIPANPYPTQNCDCAPCGPVSEECGCVSPIPNPCNAGSCKPLQTCDHYVQYRCCKYAGGRCDVVVEVTI